MSAGRAASSRRTGRKFTQEDAAEAFGVALSTYRNYEQERSLPNARTLTEMSKVYGVSADKLMGTVEYHLVELDVPSEADTDELNALFIAMDDRARNDLLTFARMLAENHRG